MTMDSILLGLSLYAPTISDEEKKDLSFVSPKVVMQTDARLVASALIKACVITFTIMTVGITLVVCVICLPTLIK